MIIIKMLVACLAFVMFCVLTAFVLLYGKRGSGIKLDYLFTALFLIAIMVLVR